MIWSCTFSSMLSYDFPLKVLNKITMWMPRRYTRNYKCPKQAYLQTCKPCPDTSVWIHSITVFYKIRNRSVCILYHVPHKVFQTCCPAYAITLYWAPELPKLLPFSQQPTFCEVTWPLNMCSHGQGRSGLSISDQPADSWWGLLCLSQTELIIPSSLFP